jgi:hypothetical protein
VRFIEQSLRDVMEVELLKDLEKDDIVYVSYMQYSHAGFKSFC